MSFEILSSWTKFLATRNLKPGDTAVLHKKEQEAILQDFENDVKNPTSIKAKRQNFRFYIILIEVYFIQLRIKLEEIIQALEDKIARRPRREYSFDYEWGNDDEEDEKMLRETFKREMMDFFPDIQLKLTNLQKIVLDNQIELNNLILERQLLEEQQKQMQEQHHHVRILTITKVLEVALVSVALMPDRATLSTLAHNLADVVQMREEGPTPAIAEKLHLPVAALKPHFELGTAIMMMGAARASGLDIKTSRDVVQALKPLTERQGAEARELSNTIGHTDTAISGLEQQQKLMQEQIKGVTNTLTQMANQIPIPEIQQFAQKTLGSVAAIEELRQQQTMTPAIHTPLAMPTSPLVTTPTPQNTGGGQKRALEEEEQRPYTSPTPFNKKPRLQ